MLEAARRLFLERGYAATTIPQIAAAADVAVPTIYWAFGSKRAIVSEIRQGMLPANVADALTAPPPPNAVAVPSPLFRLRTRI